VTVGLDSTILTSPDGVSWAHRDSGTTSGLLGISSDADLLVAVGYNGTIVVSSNAVSWTPLDSGSSDYLCDVAYGNGRFVVVGGIGSGQIAEGGTILWSPDGLSWHDAAGASGPPADYFTEWFDGSLNDLEYQSFTFTPRDGGISYSACRELARGFPTDPTAGTVVPLQDDSFARVALSGSDTVAIYGRQTNVFFIGSNGYLTFDAGDEEYEVSPTNHFALPRISAFYHDLDPSDGGTVSWQQLDDRAVVSFVQVREFDGPATVSFQVEMFFDGRIRLTYLGLGVVVGLAGLSAGVGLPADFVGSDFSSYDACGIHPPVVTTTPQSQAVVPGAPVSFSVGVFGSLPLSYQWRFNGVDLPGETNDTLTLIAVETGQTGHYSVAVSNALGGVISADAELTFVPPNTVLLEEFSGSPTRGYHPSFTAGGLPYTSPVGYFAPNGYLVPGCGWREGAHLPHGA
jgi:hypothetical protein